MIELYAKDVKVWIPNGTTVWESATITKSYKEGDQVLHIETDDGRAHELAINAEKDLPHLRNPAILIGQNDLTALSYLHEPDVLYNLEVRFLSKQTIYTYCGIVLVAINPYTDLPLYGLDIIRAYRGHSMGELEPHIFAIAEEAFAKLEREKCDISIIVSGESGAGKTMSAKYAMRYFAAVGGNESQTNIEKKVLACSPVMEAFGNAKTIRNNNSSRFGKFTQLLFANDLGVMSLIGATMRTYLLEKSRVVFQSSEERNYHILYQLCSARETWSELLLEDADKFYYLNRGEPERQIEGDRAEFKHTLHSLRTLGFTDQGITEIMQILAAILHLGNIKFSASNKAAGEGGAHEDSCNIAVNDFSLSVMCDILKINKKDLRKWLIMRQIDSYNESVLIPHNQSAAETARDALAKHIYSRLFDHIVAVINKNLVSAKEPDCFIGVLDIYGFETFDVNSFEQFCINYANEKLQQQFNQHVFKLEQEEYLREGIVWTMIDFYDNQPCIDLIETKLGVLDLLDEECRMIGGSDETWLTKLYEKCHKYDHFSKPRFGQDSFLIRHFSDTVEYDTQGFVEKNRDHISKELVGVLQMSDLSFCRQLMCLETVETPEKTSSSTKVLIRASKYATLPKNVRKTVGSQFRESLSSLITTLHKTTSHYVRCIKPNEEKAPFKWEPTKIVQQLRACGVLETVRISAAGFPSRWSYENFFERYHLLCKQKDLDHCDVQATAVKIVQKWIKDIDKYRFGKTQIFFRAGQVAYFEQLRSDTRKRYIITVQSCIRRFIYENKYKKIQRSARGLQQYGRGFLARKKASHMRQTRAAITLQRYARGYLSRKRFTEIRTAVVGIQCWGRGLIARRKYKVFLDNFRAITVQRFCRGYLARKRFAAKKRQVIIVQTLVRRFLARRQLKKLKVEARSIEHIQKMYKGLENKIIELQQRNDVIVKENQVLKVTANEVPHLKSQLETMKQLETELKQTKVALTSRETELNRLNERFQKETDEKMDILQEKTKLEEAFKSNQLQWEEEKCILESKLQDRQDSPTTKNQQMINEVEANEVHNAYQKSLKDKEGLENENTALKYEIKRLQYIVNHPNELEAYSKNSTDDSLDSKRSSAASDIAMYDNNREKLAHKDATTIILRLRKLLEEEKGKTDVLRKDLSVLHEKTGNFDISDIMRLSALEVENQKLSQDYQLLRNSIERGVAAMELESQHQTIVDELARSREECIQLKTILAQQSQSLKSLGGPARDDRVYDEHELAEAFQAQKLVNKQLELELKALTEEQNAMLTELHRQIDNLTTESNSLQAILHGKLDKIEVENGDDDDVIKQNSYLRYELQKAAADYIELQEQLNEVQAKLNEYTRQNQMLHAFIKDQGLSDPTIERANEVQSNGLVVVKKKFDQKYQGIFKYRYEDEGKIFQRLIPELSPRTALTLLPGLPAIITFMCIRYTDLVNTDQHVRTLLSQFVLGVKKIYKMQQSPIEVRILWLVNSITLLNLLKQYGGTHEYLVFSTETQKNHQLKNFDLSEYRNIVHETIISSYSILIRQIEVFIKPFVVPAVLDHDEMSRGWNRGRTKSLDVPAETPTEPKSLVNNLDGIYQKFKYFGLDHSYVEQIIKQIMYFICAVAMNNLMLRPEVCMWKSGMKIRYNVSCLETWIRDKKFSKEVLHPLQPLNEVAQVLQARKHEPEDVQTLSELCPSLTTGQVMKILKSYTLDDCENPIEPTFIEKLAEKLKERPDRKSDDTFSMDENLIIGLVLVYKHSDVKLEEVELPSVLQLDGLLTKI